MADEVFRPSGERSPIPCPPLRGATKQRTFTKLCGGEYNRSALRNTSFPLPLEGVGGVNIIKGSACRSLPLSFRNVDTVGGVQTLGKACPATPPDVGTYFLGARRDNIFYGNLTIRSINAKIKIIEGSSPYNQPTQNKNSVGGGSKNVASECNEVVFIAQNIAQIRYSIM